MAELTNAKRQAFIEEIAGYATEIFPKYGLRHVGVFVAQCCKESTFGTSDKVINHGVYMNNLAGLKNKGEKRVPIAIGSFNEKTGEEYTKGVITIITASWYRFKSFRDCVEGYCQFLVNGGDRYNKVFAANDSWTACKELKAAGYATGDAYDVSLYNDFVIPYGLDKYNLFEDKKSAGKVVKVMLDAGHDGVRNQSPVYPPYNEATFAWKLQTYLRDSLLKRGFEVGTTRSSQNEVKDVVPRGLCAKGYDLFISLHSDACGTPAVDRVSAITLVSHPGCKVDKRSQEISELLCRKVTSLMGVNDNYKVYSKPDTADRNKNGVLGDDEYYGVLHGCHSVDVAGLILEHSFHTNAKSALWLSNDANVRALAEAEAEVLADYYSMDVEVEVKPQNVIIYRTVAGDYLNKIAARFYTTVDEIIALNPSIKNPNVIPKNFDLVIPTVVPQGATISSTQGSSYIVKAGDTLDGIARRHNTTWIKLAAINGIVNPSKIYPGQVIKLGGS